MAPVGTSGAGDLRGVLVASQHPSQCAAAAGPRSGRVAGFQRVPLKTGDEDWAEEWVTFLVVLWENRLYNLYYIYI